MPLSRYLVVNVEQIHSPCFEKGECGAQGEARMYLSNKIREEGSMSWVEVVGKQPRIHLGILKDN